MLRHCTRACLLAVPMILGALVCRADSALELLVPHSGAVIHAPEVLTVYTVPVGTEVLVQVDGKVVPLPTVYVPGNERNLFHLRLPLAEGRHRVRLLDAADEAELERFTVVYVPPYSMRRPVEAGDVRYRFHTEEREASCSDCHSLPEVFETDPDLPLAPAGKVCRACHPSLEHTKYLHGPMAVYACFTCHEPGYTPARFSYKTSQADSCGTCHEPFSARILEGREFVHGPVAAGSCVTCHSPHGGATQNLLRETPPALCLGCHSETLSLPIGRALHGPVPCTRCHDPHGGRTPMFFANSGIEFCAGCHPDAARKEVGHPIPGHPVEAAADPSRPGRPLTCQSCHDPHGTRDVTRQGIQTNQEAQLRFCRKCHY